MVREEEASTTTLHSSSSLAVGLLFLKMNPEGVLGCLDYCDETYKAQQTRGPLPSTRPACLGLDIRGRLSLLWLRTGGWNVSVTAEMLSCSDIRAQWPQEVLGTQHVLDTKSPARTTTSCPKSQLPPCQKCSSSCLALPDDLRSWRWGWIGSSGNLHK